MNSKQRRKIKRKFKHLVPVETVDRMELDEHVVERLGLMLEWCHRRYGENGYHYQWRSIAIFSFTTNEHAMEFKLAWS